MPLKENEGRAGLVFLILLFASILIGLVYLFSSGPSEEVKNIIIQRGASLAQVARQLRESNIVKDDFIFKLLLRFTQGDRRVRAGEFMFMKGSSPFVVLRTLYFGDAVLHSTTIPEGWTIHMISARLSQLGLVDQKKFISLALNKKTAQRYNLSVPSMEGFLFPNTYQFSKLDGEERILDLMVRPLFEKFELQYKLRAHERGFTIERLVTLASIIEKETGVNSERPIIASVFLNRMSKNMRLQSDPTTIYGIPNFNGNLKKSDLQHHTPYNTYTIRGLPPGPIASPGTASIEAVLNPAKTDYLYFVSNNDGTHTFTKTYKEHSRHVNTSQKPRLRQKASH